MLYLPLYIDVNLVRDILGGLEIEVPEAVEIETLDSSGKSGGGKAALGGVGVDGRGESAKERRETFTKKSRPSQLLELAVSGLRESDQLIDLTVAPDTAVPRRGILEVTGHIQLSDISDVPALMSSFVPLIESGAIDTGDLPPEFLDMFGGTLESGPLILEMETDSASILLRGDTKWLLEDKHAEDVEGELTVLAYVERVLSPNESVALDRYVFPGMNRAMRRQIGRDKLLDLISSVTELHSEDVLEFAGPGIVARPIAVYP